MTPENRTPFQSPVSSGLAPAVANLSVNHSPGFPEFLRSCGISLAVTSYHAGKVILLGTTSSGKLAIAERTFDVPMALTVLKGTLFLATKMQIWRFANLVNPGSRFQDYDCVFAPRTGHMVGRMDVHDIYESQAGELVFVNTLFSCLAATDGRHNFRAIWKPSFVTALAGEDRCHLNGIAAWEGKPLYASAIAQTDTVEGWRPYRQGGGVIVDVASGQVIVAGLSMPHSPRIHDGRLFLLNSCEGTLGTVDLGSGAYSPLCHCQGFGRGLSFHGKYAFVGLSKPRKKGSFDSMPLAASLQRTNSQPICGIQVFDIESGGLVHSLSFESIIQELFSVEVIPGVLRPGLIGLSDEENSDFLSFV